MTVNYTEEEMQEFERLVNGTSSRNQLERIEARMRMPAFITEHGKEKCDAMFDVLQAKWRRNES